MYNTEKYLDECIQSIQNQSFVDFELLLVDDGSTDRSGTICDMYAEQDTRIQVFHQVNSGVMSARKTGVENSKSELICFVDSDDKLLEGALQTLYDQMSDDMDVVVAWTKLEGVITGEELVNCLLEQSILPSLWGKLYRKQVLMDSYAMDIQREFPVGEDYLANLKIALHIKRGICVPEWFYYYRKNAEGAMHKNPYTLDYVEKLMEEMEWILGSYMDLHKESWYKFQILMVRLMIMNHVPFSYKRSWIDALQKNDCGYKLALNGNIVKYVHNAFLCRLILTMGHYAKKILVGR